MSISTGRVASQYSSVYWQSSTQTTENGAFAQWNGFNFAFKDVFIYLTFIQPVYSYAKYNYVSNYFKTRGKVHSNKI